MHKPGFELLAKEPQGRSLAKKSYLKELPGELRNRIYDFIIMDIQDMLGQEQKPITATPHQPLKASPFRKSLTLTHVCKLFRHEFRPLYLGRVPFHIVTRCFTALLENFIAIDNTGSLTAPPQDTRATIVLRRAQWNDHDFVDIRSLVLLARRFPNTACTSAEDKHHDLSEQQTGNRFLEDFTQIEEFRPELLSAFEHDIASIYLEYIGFNDFYIIFKKICTEPWINKLPTDRRMIPTKAHGGLQKYIQKLGLADFGLGKLGLRMFKSGTWKARVRVSKEI